MCLADLTLAQDRLKVYYERTEDLQNCRIQIEDLKPVLAYDNPYISNHRWDAVRLVEQADLAPGRELTIEPFGCLRYHLKLSLRLTPAALEGRTLGPGLFLQELLAVLRAVNHENEEYEIYRQVLEEKLIEHLRELPYRKRINFPLHEFNVFLEIDARGGGAFAQLEFVRFVHDEVINLPGIKEYLDDGYFRGKLE